uniref:Uncharacterized protein n=1 Tax=Phyllostachys edulis TaxID=38705 RepID=D3IVK8_PHYED|nr:hypothetical protein [Phyllostachys edulis]
MVSRGTSGGGILRPRRRRRPKVGAAVAAARGRGSSGGNILRPGRQWPEAKVTRARVGGGGRRQERQRWPKAGASAAARDRGNKIYMSGVSKILWRTVRGMIPHKTERGEVFARCRLPLLRGVGRGQGDHPRSRPPARVRARRGKAALERLGRHRCPEQRKTRRGQSGGQALGVREAQGVDSSS